MSEATTLGRGGLLASWRRVLRTGNPPPGPIDPVSRWLVLTRAVVFPMTLTAAAVAGLLGARHPDFNGGWFALAAVGLVLAHAANNLMNDLFDLDVGADTDEYPRALYAPHPVLSGMISRRGLVRATAVVNVLDLGILIVLTAARGWPILGFALGGFFISAAYTAPPFRLKKRGLGEPSVLVVWGPLMVGGTYYATVGSIPWQVWAASIPYALLATAVLMGKHIDKAPWDAPKGVRTLPVMLGEPVARRVTQGMMVAFYLSVAALAAVDALPVASVIVVLALAKIRVTWAVYSHARPPSPPPGYPIWPLWYAPAAFVHTRRAGALLVLGLAAGVAWPSVLS